MNILIKPILSEKMTKISEAAAEPKLNRVQRRKGKPEPVAHNRYGFIVDRRANKYQIKSAIESFYSVKVLEINTMNYAGKVKSRYTKSGFLTGRNSAYKKAIVTLAPEQTIDFYGNI